MFYKLTAQDAHEAGEYHRIGLVVINQCHEFMVKGIPVIE